MPRRAGWERLSCARAARRSRSAAECQALFFLPRLAASHAPLELPKVEKPSDSPRANILLCPACEHWPGDGIARRHHIELADLFFECHRGEELFDLIHLWALLEKCDLKFI